MYSLKATGRGKCEGEICGGHIIEKQIFDVSGGRRKNRRERERERRE